VDRIRAKNPKVRESSSSGCLEGGTIPCALWIRGGNIKFKCPYEYSIRARGSRRIFLDLEKEAQIFFPEFGEGARALIVPFLESNIEL